MSSQLGRTRLHGSAVAFQTGPEGEWAAILILGQSGAGKSELALELVGLGASLIADDQTELTREGNRILLSAPEALRGMIELRGLGLLRMEALERAPLAVVVDLDQEETERLPYRHHTDLLGMSCPLLRHGPGRVFAIGLKHYVLARQWRDEEPRDVPARP